MNESREELIAQRDLLIEQLQGEWATKSRYKLLLIDAAEFTKYMVIGLFAFTLVGATLALTFNAFVGNDISHVRFVDAVLFVLGFNAGCSLMFFIAAFCVQAITQWQGILVVKGNNLQIQNREDSRVSLCHLTHYWVPHDEGSDRMDNRASLRPQWVGHFRECWDLDRYWLYPVRIRPDAYLRGKVLVQILDQVASLNDTLEVNNQAPV